MKHEIFKIAEVQEGNIFGKVTVLILKKLMLRRDGDRHPSG